MIHADEVKVLFADIAGHVSTIACIADDGLTSMFRESVRLSDGDLVRRTEEVLADAKWRYSDLEGVCLVNGPGGFTGLKVACSFANTLAWSLNIPVAGVHASNLWFASVTTPDLLWVHSTKKDQMFACGSGEYSALFPEPTLLSLADMRMTALPSGSYAGELIEDHRLLLEGQGMALAQVLPPADVLPGLVSRATFARETIVPWYGREG